MAVTVASTQTRPVLQPRQADYGRQIAGIMLAAFALSVGHTGYAWLAGIEDPGFTVTTPITWIFYAVAFAVSVLARQDRRWAQLVVTGFLVLVRRSASSTTRRPSDRSSRRCSGGSRTTSTSGC
jgi:hypothetical protein